MTKLIISVLLLLLALGASFLEISRRRKPGRKDRIILCIALTTFALAAILVCREYKDSVWAEHVARQAGVVGQNSNAVGAFGISFGTNYYGAAQLSGEFNIPIQLALDANSQLLITYEIPNERGTRVAYLRNNEWWGLAGAYDRNFDAECFEIVNMDTGGPILQIRRRGNRAVLLGVFRTRAGQLLIADLTGVHYEEPSEQCTWFRYPSKLHPAERNASCEIPELPTGELPFPWR